MTHDPRPEPLAPQTDLPGVVGSPAPSSPAYYARGTTGWRAWWTLLHPPYTLMHLSFVGVGAALAPTLAWDRLGWTLLAFLLAMGISAHALDEHNGRPLRTRIPSRILLVVAALALTAAGGLGLWGALYYEIPWGLLFIPVGALLVVAYNLELLGGRLHNDLTFALAWGAFPALVGYFAQTGRIDPIALGAAGYASLASATQRALSTPARRIRRETRKIKGDLVQSDGSVVPITRDLLLGPQETGLRLLVATSLMVAAILLGRTLL